jgi:hypothetical protein
MKKNSPGHFDKFAKKKSNAAIKEQFKQDKRKWKKEREEFFEKKKLEGRGHEARSFRQVDVKPLQRNPFGQTSSLNPGNAIE